MVIRSTTDAVPRPQMPPFVINRVFEAPRVLVWKAWTERERLARWWGPKGFAVDILKADVRPGGVFHFGMRSKGGRQHWGRFDYREIVAPERLVFTVAFADENGNVARNPFDADWPLQMLSTVTFAERQALTTVTVTQAPMMPSAAERKAFEAGRESMRAGWNGTCDKLALYLAKP
jgi:uncharacterized protein YndB with AHSA1/START domain